MSGVIKVDVEYNCYDHTFSNDGLEWTGLLMDDQGTDLHV